MSTISVQKQRTLYTTLNNYLSVSVDFSSATWNTVAKHEVFTVTGMVRVLLIPECTEDLTSGGAATFEFGQAEDTAYFVSLTAFDGINSGDMIMNNQPKRVAAFPSEFFDHIFLGADIGYEIKTAALTNGTIVFHCWWESLNSTGNVVAGAGGVF